MKAFLWLLKIYRQLCVVAVFVFIAMGCEKTVFNVKYSSAGDTINATLLKIYAINEIRQILNAYQIPDSFKLAHSVEAVAISYQTTDAEGKNILASGALLIPQNADELPMLSLQHGTETKRDRVASISPLNSVEGVSGLLTTSLGYVTCIPDYPGFGLSNTLHPYLHAKSLTKSVVDFIIAARTYCNNHHISLNDQLFLMGYSEGGFVTLATQKEIEEKYSQKFNITAVAPMAGPYDLKGTSNFIFKQTEYPYPAYIGFFLYAYETLYDLNRIEIFNPPYENMMPVLFDGSKSFSEINSQLPVDIHSLINQKFIDDYFAGNEKAFQNTLDENTLLNWTPVAPLHFFHGDADDVVLYQNAVTAVKSLKANGATDIQLTTIAGGTHETAGLPSVMGAIEWFETMRTQQVSQR